MVIPWIGFPLCEVHRARADPLASAKYVPFETLLDPSTCRASAALPAARWPYVEGLRLDEAMHPLTILAVGLYGDELPPQNGAPLRLVVPWKYGFKVDQVDRRITPDRQAAADHLEPCRRRTSTASIRTSTRRSITRAGARPPSGAVGAGRLLAPSRDTEMFNGYAEEVAHLYAGMDLREFYRCGGWSMP